MSTERDRAMVDVHCSCFIRAVALTSSIHTFHLGKHNAEALEVDR